MKELQSLKEQMESVVKSYCYGFDPCPKCKKRNRKNSKETEECLKCCFYYGSNFEVDDGIKDNCEN